MQRCKLLCDDTTDISIPLLWYSTLIAKVMGLGIKSYFKYLFPVHKNEET